MPHATRPRRLIIPFTIALAACTQSGDGDGARIAELSDQLDETNTRLAEIAERLDAIESRLESRQRDDDARLERMRAARRDARLGGSDAAAPIDATKLDAGISCTDAGCKIQKSLLEEILANPAGLARSVRVIPAMDDGIQRGFKLYGIRRQTIMGRLGFQNGDRVLTINGMTLDSPDRALEAYVALREAKQLDVEIERKGKAQKLTLEIE
jgi:hypothetical protein